MHEIDWAIVAGYALIPLIISFYFMRRAAANQESYLLAGRKLPWYVIGFSACATYTSAGSSFAFSLLIFTGGLAGNWVWWLPYAIWMPLVAAIWSKYWRRLKVTTTAEFFEKRYSGKAAGYFRGIYGVFMAFGWGALLNGYVTGLLVRGLQPILGWSPLMLLVAFLGVTLVYLVISGMLSVTYNDIPQFLVFFIGNLIFVPFVVAAAGGLDAMYDTVATVDVGKGVSFLDPFPSGLGAITVGALIVQGFFFAGAPSGGEGYTAQLFMAAKNEFHAQLGQLFNSVMTLVVRMIPLIFIGLAATALYSGTGIAPEDVWGKLVSDHATVGLMGLLVAAELAAFMSTVDTHVNWQTSYIVNDVIKRFFMPDATEKQSVLLCRLSNAFFLLLSGLIGYYVATGGHGIDTWFFYINTVMVAFVLPLAWLRFFWWRLNIYAEIAALVIGMPLGYIMWFTLGFSEWPLGYAFLALFAMGWAVIIMVTFLTPPESMERLTKFYQVCRPPGFWGPVSDMVKPEERQSIREESKSSVAEGLIGVVFCLSLVTFMTTLFAKQWGYSIGMAISAGAAGFALFRRFRARAFFDQLETEQKEIDHEAIQDPKAPDSVA